MMMDIKEALKDANWWCPPCMEWIIVIAPRKPRSMDTMGRKRSKTGQFEKESYPSKDILMPEDVHNRRHVGKCICWGMFCGVYLKNRYGMDIKEALKDDNWWCPPCMDYCNCSNPRKRIPIFSPLFG